MPFLHHCFTTVKVVIKKGFDKKMEVKYYWFCNILEMLYANKSIFYSVSKMLLKSTMYGELHKVYACVSLFIVISVISGGIPILIGMPIIPRPLFTFIYLLFSL